MRDEQGAIVQALEGDHCVVYKYRCGVPTATALDSRLLAVLTSDPFLEGDCVPLLLPQKTRILT